MALGTPVTILVAQPAGGGFARMQVSNICVSRALVEQLFGNAALIATIGFFMAIISGTFS